MKAFRLPRALPAALLALVLALAAAGLSTAARERPPFPSGDPVQVVAIVDGDTLDVKAGGGTLRIRFFGVDCPERDQAFGTRARSFTSDLAFGRMVRLVPRDWDDRDGRRPRLVAEVILPDGRSLNRELVRAGYAWVYRKYTKDRALIALEGEARAARLGLWADPDPVPPWSFRRKKPRG